MLVIVVELQLTRAGGNLCLQPVKSEMPTATPCDRMQCAGTKRTFWDQRSTPLFQNHHKLLFFDPLM